MGIKRNIIYSGILTTSNYLFPLIVYPYVSRVLGVNNIGLCNFIDSIINYFILFSMMGIGISGTRQIAVDRANKNSLDTSFSSLLSLNAIATIISIVVLILLTLYVPELNSNKELMEYGGLKLVSNLFLIEWFYKGIEDFRFITLRTILVKILYVISIFIFVKTSEDYTVYYLLTVLMITVNAAINFIYSGRFVKFRLRLINLSRFFKPFLGLGVFLILTSLYTTFNVVYLGFISTDTQVGFYTTATKLYSILLALFTGVTTVLMPRMSNLIAQNKMDEFKNVVFKSTNILIKLSLPLIIFTEIFSPQIVMLISGPGFEGAITPMRIVMPLILVIGYEQIQVIQSLLPLHRDKTVLFNSSVGAGIGVLLNLLLVPRLFAIGSSITWVGAEVTIMILSQISLYKLMKLTFPWSNLLKSIVYNTPLAAILLFIDFNSFDYPFWSVLIIAAFATLLYFIAIECLILKEFNISKIVLSIKKR